MSKDTFQKRQTPTSVKPMLWVAVSGLVLIVVVSLIIGIIAWSQNPAKDTLGFELAKTSMQVVGVTLIGAVAATAAFAIQQSIADKVSQLADERENTRVNERRREDLNRERRHRQDDLVRTMLNDTVDAYNRVKNIRRSLQASVGKPSRNNLRRSLQATVERSGGNLSIEDYDKWLPEISAQQPLGPASGYASPLPGISSWELALRGKSIFGAAAAIRATRAVEKASDARCEK